MSFAEFLPQQGVVKSDDVEALSDSIMEVNTMGLEESLSDEDRQETDGLIEIIKAKFNNSKQKKFVDETRMLECYRNHRGVYGPSTQFTDTEKSRVFVKITKTKVQAAVAQIVDVLFAGNKFPIGVEPPKIAVGVESAINLDPKDQQQAGPAPAKNPQMDPHIAKLFGPKKKILEEHQDALKSGIGLTPSAITFEPAKEAAQKMEKKIQDQLNESGAYKSLRSLVSELCMLGTGVYKGPFAIDKEYPKWNEDGSYAPTKTTIPAVEHVSVWDAYPDADARNMDECEYFIQRHRLSRTALRALKKRQMFRGKNIEKLIEEGPNYTPEWFEADLTEDSNSTTHDRWEVLEYWGMMDAETAKESGIKVPKEFKNFDEFQINAWISGNHVLRLVINPFKPTRIPYYAVPYELNPYSFFGIGVAENMMDTQLIMNGMMRMTIDNAAMAGNLVFEMNEDLLVPGQSKDLYPGKIFYKQGLAQGKAIESTKYDSTAQENMMLFDKARQLADEATGMPSFAHGMSGIQSTGKTAAGMSMLMGAAAQNIKAVVRNIDDYLLSQLGRDLFAFNMQFNFDKDYIGDVVVVAKGTESLMRNEVRSQRLMQLSQFAAGNQMMAPMIKWDYILREYVASLDLDEDLAVNDPRAATLQALHLQKLQQMMAPPTPPGEQGQQQQAEGNGQIPGASVPSVEDPTQSGNGNIGPGAAPEPGAEGFSGDQAA